MTEHSTTAFSRRNLLAAVGLGGAAAAAYAAPALRLTWDRKPGAAGWWDGGARSLARGAMADWQAQIGSSFRAEDGSRLKLVKVAAVPNRGARPAGVGRSHAFTAVFEAPAGAAPEGNRTYTMEHDSHGRMDVFVSAPSPKGGAVRLEAVFG
jgi:hypothetical protein